jgi:hypothetical protein
MLSVFGNPEPIWLIKSPLFHFQTMVFQGGVQNVVMEDHNGDEHFSGPSPAQVNH